MEIERKVSKGGGSEEERDTVGDAKEKRGRTGGTARQVYPGPASFSALV